MDIFLSDPRLGAELWCAEFMRLPMVKSYEAGFDEEPPFYPSPSFGKEGSVVLTSRDLVLPQIVEFLHADSAFNLYLPT